MHPSGLNAAGLFLELHRRALPSGQPLGYLTVWPTGEPQPSVSTLNNLTGTIVANAAIVPAGTGGGIAAYASNDTDLVIDINGYFAAPGPGGLSLYPAAPCRVIDTRKIGNGQPFSGELTRQSMWWTARAALPSTAAGICVQRDRRAERVAGLSDAVAGQRNTAGSLNAECHRRMRSPRTWRSCPT